MNDRQGASRSVDRDSSSRRSGDYCQRGIAFVEPFIITCATCRARLKVRDVEAIGQILNCPKCNSMVHVSPPDAVASAQPASVPSTPSTEPNASAAVGAASEPAASTPRWREAEVETNADVQTEATEEALVRGRWSAAWTIGRERLARRLAWASRESWRVGLGFAAGIAVGGLAWWGLTTLLANGSASRRDSLPVESRGSKQGEIDSPAEPSRSADTVVAPSPVGEENGTASAKDSAENVSMKVADPAPTKKPRSAPETTENAEPPKAQAPEETPAAESPVETAAPKSADSPNKREPTVASSSSSSPNEEKPAKKKNSPSPRRDQTTSTPVDVEARLADPIAGLQFRGTTLVKFAAFVSELSTIPIELDLDKLADRGMSPQTPVTLRTGKTTVRQALDAALGPAGLAWRVEQGRVIVSPRAKPDSNAPR